MKQAAKGTRYWLDHHDMSGQLNAVDMDVTQELPNVTCFSDAGPRVVIGNYSHKHALRGFFDGSSSQIDAVANALIGTTANHYLAELFAGTAIFDLSYESIVQSAGEPVRVAAGSAIVQEIPLEGGGGLARGLIYMNGTITSTSTATTAITADIAAGNDGPTFLAVVRYFSGTFTNCVIDVQHSSNGTTWANISGMTATSTGNGKAVGVTSTTGIKQYRRAICSAFTGTDAVVSVTAGWVAGSA